MGQGRFLPHPFQRLFTSSSTVLATDSIVRQATNRATQNAYWIPKAAAENSRCTTWRAARGLLMRLLSVRDTQEHSFCHTLTNKGIQHVINYDAFSLFDKLSLSSKYVAPTFIIVLNTVLLTHRFPARHYTCSHRVDDRIDICFSINSDVTASRKWDAC